MCHILQWVSFQKKEEMDAAYEEIRDIDEVFSTKVRKISVEMIGENEESIIIIEKELE